jgi:hypothetical protein
MSVKHILSEIAGYLGSTRGIGHTTAVIKGFNTSPMPVAVTATEDYGKRVFGQQNYVSVDNLASLRGVRRPLVIDNSALEQICQEALEMIVDLESENRILNNRIQAIRNLVT